MTLSRFIILASAVLLMAGVCLGGFVVCPKCGYENDDARVACTHCQAELPRKAPADDAPDQDADAGIRNAASPITAAMVSADIAAGMDAFREGDVELARLFFQNAAAMDTVAAVGLEASRSEELVRLIEDCRGAARVQRKCPECGGNGKKLMSSTNLKGETVYREVPGRSCERCRGTGMIATRGTVDERIFALGRAMQRYRTRQRARKHVAVGEVWVPADVSEALSIEETAALMRARPRPCPDCMGFGQENCDECNGLGTVDCPEKDCDHGMVTVEEGGRLGGRTIERKERCKTCEGRGFVACPECRGAGSVLCRECNGSGERPPCRKCGGQGLNVCRRCDGTGTDKGVPCTACAAGGSVLCKSCNGDGRKR